MYSKKIVLRLFCHGTLLTPCSIRAVREPNDEEFAELSRMTRQEVGRVALRAHIILLSRRVYSASEIVRIHDVTGPVVHKWFDRFDEESTSDLYDHKLDGRPKKITGEAEGENRASPGWGSSGGRSKRRTLDD